MNSFNVDDCFRTQKIRDRYQDRFFEFKGHVIIETKYKEEDWKKVHDDPNCVVFASFPKIAELLATGSKAEKLAKIQYGTGKTPAKPSDTNLEHPVGTAIKDLPKGVIGGTDANKSLTYTVTVGKEEMNGYEFQEAGLFFEKNVLMARETFAPINKNKDLSFRSTWIISMPD